MASEQGPSAVGTILVVDDNEGNRALALNTLEDEGYRVVLASGGEEGIAAFERERPDCILLDVRMPDVDGFAACERIRALAGGPDTPILFLTALRDIDTFDRALSAGGDDFLTKPIRPTELVVRVHTAVKLRKMRLELGEHYALLKQQRDDLMRLQLQKERLTAFVVHDLKNPVHAMDLHAQLLLRDRTLSPDARESAETIRSEARQLTRMILNLLDVSRAEEGKLAPRRSRVDLPKLVGEVFAELSIHAEARKVELRSSLGVLALEVDEDLFRRVLTNLIENAIRYAPNESVVTVGAQREASKIELRVADAGPGIPPSMRERIFEPFAQLGTSDEPSGRTSRGLGLSYCKLAIEAHDGTIWTEDAAPGATFCVSLPESPPLAGG